MKMKGHSFDAPNRELCILPRSGGDVVFYADAVLDWDEFDRVYPVPKPPSVIKPGGITEVDYENPAYVAKLMKRNELRMAWLVLKSLENTPDLEWETIDMQKPNTWMNFQKELKDAFFSTAEIARIQTAVLEANSISESRIQEARENFARGQRALKAVSSGPNIEPETSQSGDHVNVLASDPLV